MQGMRWIVNENTSIKWAQEKKSRAIPWTTKYHYMSCSEITILFKHWETFLIANKDIRVGNNRDRSELPFTAVIMCYQTLSVVLKLNLIIRIPIVVLISLFPFESDSLAGKMYEKAVTGSTLHCTHCTSSDILFKKNKYCEAWFVVLKMRQIQGFRNRIFRKPVRVGYGK